MEYFKVPIGGYLMQFDWLDIIYFTSISYKFLIDHVHSIYYKDSHKAHKHKKIFIFYLKNNYFYSVF